MNLWKVEILLTMCVLINTFVNQKFIYVLWLFFLTNVAHMKPKGLKIEYLFMWDKPFSSSICDFL